MIAIMFSGQGSQYPEMGRTLDLASAAAHSVFGEACRVLGYDTLQLTGEQLSQTRYAQPAIVALSLAAWHALQDGWSPPANTVLAGFSLGEYSALAAAGVLDTADVLALVKERARLMQAAAQTTKGGMAAVIGLQDSVILDLLDRPLYRDKVYAVNFNAPGQVVLSGLTEVLPDCLAACSQAGARRVIPLDVNGAFHTPLMQPAADRLADYAAHLSFAPAHLPLFSNTDAAQLPETLDWPAYLARHLCSPVRWIDEVRAIASEGVTSFWELGPGKVLSGLVRKILPGVKTGSADRPEDLATLCAHLKPD